MRGFLFWRARSRADVTAARRRPWMALGQNLIVSAGYDRMIQMLATGDADLGVDRMQFGTNGSDPDATDVMLYQPIAPAKALATIDHVDATTIALETALENDEANGFFLAEAGLLAEDGVLIARKTFTMTQAKTSDYIFDFRWVLDLKA